MEATAARNPGIFARAVETWRNPAYRFVILFLIYLLIAATLYPPFTQYFPDVVYGMMTFTAACRMADRLAAVAPGISKLSLRHW